MNSIQKISTGPMRQCFTGSVRRSLPAPVVDTTPARRLGCAHIAPSRQLDVFFGDQSAFEMEHVVQLKTPADLKAATGIEKLFAEKKGFEIVAFAATKKLLEEEKLRQGLKTFCVPLEGIVRQNYRQKPSSFRPICPVIQEEM